MTKTCNIFYFPENFRPIKSTHNISTALWIQGKDEVAVYQRAYVRPNPRYRQWELVSFTKTVVIEDRAHHIQKTKTKQGKLPCGIRLRVLNFWWWIFMRRLLQLAQFKEIKFGIAEKASEWGKNMNRQSRLTVPTYACQFVIHPLSFIWTGKVP